MPLVTAVSTGYMKQVVVGCSRVVKLCSLFASRAQCTLLTFVRALSIDFLVKKINFFWVDNREGDGKKERKKG